MRATGGCCCRWASEDGRRRPHRPACPRRYLSGDVVVGAPSPLGALPAMTLLPNDMMIPPPDESPATLPTTVLAASRTTAFAPSVRTPARPLSLATERSS